MVKKKKSFLPFPLFSEMKVFPFGLGILLGAFALITITILAFEKNYQGKIYPGVKILGVNVGGKKTGEVERFLREKNLPFENLKITFSYQEKIATLSGKAINLGFDSKLSSRQAFLIGRKGNFFSQFSTKSQALRQGVEVVPLFQWHKKPLEEILAGLAKEIDILPQNALFRFMLEGNKGKVVVFQPSKKGRRVNAEKTLRVLEEKLPSLAKQLSPSSEIKVSLQVEAAEPKVNTSQANNLGIEEFLGKGVSYFKSSSPERMHNIGLASSRLDGLLIAPGEIFSLSEALGEISIASGYQSSYIIKEGKTVLGDGGGVCQVSTTLFRTGLNVGLPILERHPHSYRVSYYEQGGFSPGLDAAIFTPSVDLKMKNNSPAYILIQTNFNLNTKTLAFELYGKKDGRTVEISEVKVWDQKSPPEDKYIDDPTLPKDQIKQIDWKAWGTKTSFNYKVTRNGEILEETSFYSNFSPWQAIFLRGTRE